MTLGWRMGFGQEQTSLTFGVDQDKEIQELDHTLF